MNSNDGQARTNGTPLDPRTLSLNGVFHGTPFELLVTDRDVLDAISRYESPAQAVDSLLRIGAAAMFAASTGFDVAAIRSELHRAVSETREALLEMQQRVDAATAEDGVLTTSLKHAADDLETSLRKAAEAQGDPNTPGTLLANIRENVRSFAELITSTRVQLSDELARTVQTQNDALSRAVRDIREVDATSPLGQALALIEKRLTELSAIVAAGAARSAERNIGTAKGAEFEEDVAQAVAAICVAFGDRAERTGQADGKLILNRRPCRRGDVTCFAAGAPQIVIEAMDRGRTAITATAIQTELDEAMRNRGARAAIAVLSSSDNSVMCGLPLQFLGPNSWAVVMDREVPSLLALQVAYSVARHTAMAPETAHGTVDFERVKAGIAQINRSLVVLSEVKTQLGNIRDCDTKAEAALARHEREVAAAVMQLMNSLVSSSEQEVA